VSANGKRHMSIDVTPEMRAFLLKQVRDGRAFDPSEVVRGLIAREICRWEQLHHRPFDAKCV
jgi:Arc/MetJ-type ribon-helix-helix transcriptional regulator